MAADLVVIDTSVWIPALRRRPNSAFLHRVDALLGDGRAAIVPPVRVELLGGARTEAERDRLRARLEGLFLIPLTHDDWDTAADWSFRLRRRGRTVPTLDLLIAAPAHRTGAVLLHADADFNMLADVLGIRVETIPGH